MNIGIIIFYLSKIFFLSEYCFSILKIHRFSQRKVIDLWAYSNSEKAENMSSEIASRMGREKLIAMKVWNDDWENYTRNECGFQDQVNDVTNEFVNKWREQTVQVFEINFFRF